MKYYVYANTNDFYIERAKRAGKYDMLCQHYHNAYEFLFVLEGKRYVFFNEGTYELKKGDLVILTPYTIHYTESRESEYAEIYAINVSSDFLCPMFMEGEIEKQIRNISSCVVHLEEKSFDTIFGLFEQMNRYIGKPEPFGNKILRSYVFVFLNEINNICKNNLRNINENKGIGYSNEFAKAISYIVKNYKEDITLDFMVNYVHMSKSHFCYTFEKETGSTFLRYVNNLRAAEAHRLLMETDLRICEIANNAGFRSVAHMTRVFKEVHGISPTMFRKKNKIKE